MKNIIKFILIFISITMLFGCKKDEFAQDLLNIETLTVAAPGTATDTRVNITPNSGLGYKVDWKVGDVLQVSNAAGDSHVALYKIAALGDIASDGSAKFTFLSGSKLSLGTKYRFHHGTNRTYADPYNYATSLQRNHIDEAFDKSNLMDVILYTPSAISVSGPISLVHLHSYIGLTVKTAKGTTSKVKITFSIDETSYEHSYELYNWEEAVVDNSYTFDFSVAPGTTDGEIVVELSEDKGSTFVEVFRSSGSNTLIAGMHYSITANGPTSSEGFPVGANIFQKHDGFFGSTSVNSLTPIVIESTEDTETYKNTTYRVGTLNGKTVITYSGTTWSSSETSGSKLITFSQSGGILTITNITLPASGTKTVTFTATAPNKEKMTFRFDLVAVPSTEGFPVGSNIFQRHDGFPGSKSVNSLTPIVIESTEDTETYKNTTYRVGTLNGKTVITYSGTTWSSSETSGSKLITFSQSGGILTITNITLPASGTKTVTFTATAPNKEKKTFKFNLVALEDFPTGMSIGNFNSSGVITAYRPLSEIESTENYYFFNNRTIWVGKVGTDETYAKTVWSTSEDGTGEVHINYTDNGNGSMTISSITQPSSETKRVSLIATAPSGETKQVLFDLLPPPAGAPTSITLDKDLFVANVGVTLTLTPTILPDNTETNKNLIWSSSNTSVASVDSKGKVTTKAGGSAIITAKASVGTESATCTIKVNTASPSGSYSVGDYYPNSTNPIGIVFWIDSPYPGGSASSGKIIALDEGEASYGLDDSEEVNNLSLTDGLANMKVLSENSSNLSKYPAAQWAHQKNAAGTTYSSTSKNIWYLPSALELRILYAAMCGLRMTRDGESPNHGNGVIDDWGLFRDMYPAATNYTTERNSFNKKLTDKGGHGFNFDGNSYDTNINLISSSEDSGTSIFFISLKTARVGQRNKESVTAVRAIMAF